MGTTGNSHKNALIFIPDISGFTEFVNNTEISHAKHIIEELLEVLIDANDIGLELSEIEGDALLFYRRGEAPSRDELLRQIRIMYVAFHGLIKKYDSFRICSCGACSQASNLSLKFIAHYGEVAEKNVKNHKKLFGKDVILAHRLLKNDIPSSEYGLFSNYLLKTDDSWKQLDEIENLDIETIVEKNDLGEVECTFINLDPFQSDIPEPDPVDYNLPGVTEHLIKVESVIQAPLDLVFNVISDLEFRKEITVGLKDVDEVNHKIAQNGSTHRCVINENDKDPFFHTHDFKFDRNKITFLESDEVNNISTVWVLTRQEDHTLIEFNNYMKPNFIKKLLFRIFLKKKLIATMERTMENLNNYCKTLVSEGRRHTNEIILPAHVHSEH